MSDEHNRLPTADGHDPDGLRMKYRIERVDGRDVVFGPHYGCALFVLDLTHDPHARAAALAYADSADSTRPQLADDLRKKVMVAANEDVAKAVAGDD